jgi:hypothetical protein
MAPGWSEERCRAAFESGRREAQHKWLAMGGTWHPADREAVVTVAGEISAPSP